MQHLLSPFRRLQWKLTFSFTLVTVAALLVVELIILAGVLAFASSDFLKQAIVQAFRDTMSPQASAYLEQTPPDLVGLNEWVTALFNNEQTTLQINDQPRITNGLNITFSEEEKVFILDPQGRLLSQTPLPDSTVLGQPFDLTSIPGLSDLLPYAIQGETDIEKLYTILPNGHLLMVLPIPAKDGSVLGVMVAITPLPALNWETLRPLLLFTLYSVIPFTLAAGLIGTIFGFLTARTLTRRLRGLSQAASAWSQGDFSAVAQDNSGDEIGQLTRRLNQMAEQLQNLLAARQELATLEERNRLARDLHDSVKQQVFATAMQIGAAKTLLERDPQAAREHLQEAEQLAKQSQRELAGLIQELRPAQLDGKGLVEALREFTTDWSRRTAIPAWLRTQGERPLPLPIEQALFRVSQEALANVARHSQAQTAELHLTYETNAVTLTIQDDGRGFQPNQTGEGMGLRSMKERVEALNGRLTIHSTPGQGTQVTAVVTIFA